MSFQSTLDRICKHWLISFQKTYIGASKWFIWFTRIYHIWFSSMPDINTIAVKNTNLLLCSTVGCLINKSSAAHFALFLKRYVPMINMLPFTFISSGIIRRRPSCVGSYLCAECKDALTVFDRWGDPSYHGKVHFHRDEARSHIFSNNNVILFFTCLYIPIPAQCLILKA